MPEETVNSTAPEMELKLNTLDAIFSASLVVQCTLLVLVLLSVVSWGILFAKRRQFAQIELADEKFLNVFWKAHSWSEFSKKESQNFAKSPCARVFQAGFKELQKIADSQERTDDPSGLIGLDNLIRALRKAKSVELAHVEHRLSILATTGSTAVYIGLFGTVWGIMNAFQKIGATGAAHLAVVAPGISEALVATAFGLFVAIPAMIFYNHFVVRLKKVETDMTNFSSDFVNVARRNFF